MVYIPGRSEAYWRGFKDGMAGYLDGQPTEFNIEYERGLILGLFERRERKRNEESPWPSRNEIPATS